MTQSFRSPRKVLRRLKLTPLAIRHIRNWPSFMLHYALGLKPSGPYHFRSGAKIAISRAIDHVPIIEIFLKRDYGDMPQNATILDLGANIGVFSIYATTTARGNRVYAYEPFTHYAAFVETNARLNEQESAIRCFPMAVAGSEGERTLFVGGTDFFFPTLVGQKNNDQSITISCTTLPKIIASNQLSKVDLLKMDCEGAEYEILYATPPEIFRLIHEIRMEYHNLDHEKTVESLKQFLQSQGFQVTHEQANSPTNGNLWMVRS